MWLWSDVHLTVQTVVENLLTHLFQLSSKKRKIWELLLHEWLLNCEGGMPNDTTFDWPMLCSIDPQYENTWLIWKLSCYMRRRYKISSSRNLLANVLIGWYFRVSNTLNWTKDMWNRCCCIVFVGTSTNLRHSSSNGLLFPQTYKFLQCIICCEYATIPFYKYHLP